MYPNLNSQNTPKMGVSSRFQAKHAIYSNFCIIKTSKNYCSDSSQISHSNKIRHAASLLVIPKCAPRLQHGGQPLYQQPFVRFWWNFAQWHRFGLQYTSCWNKNCDILTTAVDFYEILEDNAYWPSGANGCSKFKFLKIQDGRQPPF